MDHRDERIRRFFQDLRSDTMDLVDGFYHPAVVFEDPVGRLESRDALRRYYAGLYENVISIGFDFEEFVGDGDSRAAAWTMRLASKKLEGGREFEVPGMSRFRFDPETDLVIHHRDYFDLGAFVYERIPVLGRVVRSIKRRLESH